MQPFILISILVFGFLVVGLLITMLLALRKSKDEPITSEQGRHPTGYWIGTGMSLGAGFGVALGIVFDNFALGIAIGAGLGSAIGAALEQSHKGEVRPPTGQEARLQKWGLVAGLLALLTLTGLVAFLSIMKTR